MNNSRARILENRRRQSRKHISNLLSNKLSHRRKWKKSQNSEKSRFGLLSKGKCYKITLGKNHQKTNQITSNTQTNTLEGNQLTQSTFNLEHSAGNMSTFQYDVMLNSTFTVGEKPAEEMFDFLPETPNDSFPLNDDVSNAATTNYDISIDGYSDVTTNKFQTNDHYDRAQMTMSSTVSSTSLDVNHAQSFNQYVMADSQPSTPQQLPKSLESLDTDHLFKFSQSDQQRYMGSYNRTNPSASTIYPSPGSELSTLASAWSEWSQNTTNNYETPYNQPFAYSTIAPTTISPTEYAESLYQTEVDHDRYCTKCCTDCKDFPQLTMQMVFDAKSAGAKRAYQQLFGNIDEPLFDDMLSPAVSIASPLTVYTQNTIEFDSI